MAFLCAILTLVLVSLGFGQDINGKWKGSMQGPDGAFDLVFNFKVSADSLTGTVEGPMGDMPIINGKMNGKEFTFDVDFNGMTINHQCTMLGDSIAMKVPGMQGDTMEAMLKRTQ
jgi:hypothetical protein